MRFSASCTQDGRAPFYLTTIAEGNETALDVLTSGRAGCRRITPPAAITRRRGAAATAADAPRFRRA